MEATGVYWKPVWHILSDGEFHLVLANAAHVKNVPGRKTDVNDATWLADLMAHGLIRSSFVPDEPTEQMRNLLRTRKQFVRERASQVQRIQKTLEDANIKLDSVISDVVGVSGRRMLEALIDGNSAPQELAAWRMGVSEPRQRNWKRLYVVGSHRITAFFLSCIWTMWMPSMRPLLVSTRRSTSRSNPFAALWKG
jgi:hypothetical protein